MTHRLATNYAKNYCNRTPIVKVIVVNVVTCFLGHSVHNLLTEKLDTVDLLLVELIGSVVISLTRCCLPNDEGLGPPNIFFLEPPLVLCRNDYTYH